jgi:small basic protein
MKHLIHNIIALVIGIGIGAYRWRTTVQNKAIEIAEIAYTEGAQAVLSGWSAELEAQFQWQIDELKIRGEEYAKELIRQQIDNLFE